MAGVSMEGTVVCLAPKFLSSLFLVQILQEASSLCNQRFRIEHVTIQVEC